MALIVLVGIGIWKTSGRVDADRVAVVRQCDRVMGTDCRLIAVVPYGREATAEDALERAEAMLRALESRLSTWIADSEVSNLNAAPAGKLVPLSEGSIEILRAAQRAWQQTGGAFDITCGPLVQLWRRAGRRGVLPGQSEIHEARKASHWKLIELTDTGAVKHSAAARVDIDGIAKGYAIDRAADILRKAGLRGGLVEIGGDLVCFGQPPEGKTWPLGVKDPRGQGKLATLRLRDEAVCTSGDYERFIEIAGKRYHHIIDPRTGRPADAVPSVTVVAADAMTADVWATALSVLGPEGLRRLPEGVEAMVVVGTADDRRIFCSRGFLQRLEERPDRIEVVE